MQNKTMLMTSLTVFYGLFALILGAQPSDGKQNSALENSSLQTPKQSLPANLTQMRPGCPLSVNLKNSESLDFIWCPPGTFLMGSPKEDYWARADEVQHAVTLSHGFWLGKTELTQSQWEAVMDNNPSGFRGKQLPVETIDWNQAMEFCRKLTDLERAAGHLSNEWRFDLPTEAQWEYACRGGTTSSVHDGTTPARENPAANLQALAWYGANSGHITHPVAQKRPNPWGFYDIYGNVEEWCRDWYGKYSGDATDPEGTAHATGKQSRGLMSNSIAARGGTWNVAPNECRSGRRSVWGRSRAANWLGFRPALVFNGETKPSPANNPIHETRIENSDTPPAQKPEKALLPSFEQQLQGHNEVRVRNPNQFAVTVGLRSGNAGTNFEVAVNSVASAFVPDGKYDIFFVYSSEPDSLFQGDSFRLAGNGVEIRIVKMVHGNYGIKRVK